MHPPPELSVIIPTNRRPDILAPCLRALAGQDIAHDRFEVLVMNDGAAHDLQPLAATMAAEGLNVRVFDLPQGGPGPARSRGAQEARGSLLVFTDDDCLPEPQWLSTMLAASEQHPDALLGGCVVNVLTHRPASEASQVLVSFLYIWYNRDPLDGRFFTSNNIAARRDRFLALGGFDRRFVLSAGEDRDLCARWRERGGRLVYVPAARIGHAHDLTVRKFWRQHYKYGRGAAMYWAAREHALDAAPTPQAAVEITAKGRHAVTVEPPAFYWQLMRYPLVSLPWPRAVAIWALVVLSQVANAAGFVLAARRWPRLQRG